MEINVFLRKSFESALWGASHLRSANFVNAAHSIEQMFQKLVISSSDSVTGLVQRTFFFERLMETLEEKLPHFEKTGECVWAPDVEVNFIAGDLAFLAYYNAMSHAKGDEVLVRMAQIFKHRFIDSWVARMGGDEFAAFTTTPVQQTYAMMQAVSEEVSEKPLQYLNLGHASLADVWTFFEGYGVPTTRRLKTAANVLADIAMTRAQIKKIYERIDLFVDLYRRHDGSYEDLVAVARKGAAGVEDTHIAEWAIRLEAGENIAPECLIFALEKKRTAMRDAGPYYAAIFEVAERTFFTPR